MESATRDGPGDAVEPLLSVGIPVWNGMPYLEKAVESVRRQEFDDFEVVVCDNASTDGTADYLARVAGEDPRVRHVRNDENIGGTSNFNRAFRLARGRYFKWAGADDFVSPGVLSRCVEVLEADPSVVLAHPETVYVDESGERTGSAESGSGWDHRRPSRRFEYSLTRWGRCNVLYGVVRSDVLEQTVLLDDYPGSDLVLQADLAIRGRLRRVEGERLYRRVHPEATAGLSDEELARFYVPGRGESFDARYLRLFRRLAGVVSGGDVALGEKRRMFAALLRHAIWARTRLASEVAALARRLPDRLVDVVRREERQGETRHAAAGE